MALHTVTICYDDLDASTDGVTTHQLTLDGVSWEIDLSEANLDRLREALRPFMAAGRRLPASRAIGRTTAARGRAGRTATAAMRRWWLKNHDRHDLPAFRDRGAIPPEVRQAYRHAHQA